MGGSPQKPTNQNRAKHDPLARTQTKLVILSEAKDPLLNATTKPGVFLRRDTESGCPIHGTRARRVARPEDWKWSSVPAHLAGLDDALVTVQPVLDRVPHLKPLLLQGNAEEDFSDLRRAESTGRPRGAPEFVISLESLLGRKMARRAPSRKPEMQSTDAEQLELL